MGKKSSSKKTPIFLAVDNDDKEEVAQLLRENSIIHTERNSDGWTPLMAAAFSGSTSCIEILIEAGANVSLICKDGDTAMHYASAQGYTDIITLLAKAGASLICLDNDGESPIDVAANGKVKKVIEKLIIESEKRKEEDCDKNKKGQEEDDDDDGEEEEGREGGGQSNTSNPKDSSSDDGDGSGAPKIRFGSKKSHR